MHLKAHHPKASFNIRKEFFLQHQYCGMSPTANKTGKIYLKKVQRTQLQRRVAVKRRVCASLPLQLHDTVMQLWHYLGRATTSSLCVPSDYNTSSKLHPHPGEYVRQSNYCCIDARKLAPPWIMRAEGAAVVACLCCANAFISPSLQPRSSVVRTKHTKVCASLLHCTDAQALAALAFDPVCLWVYAFSLKFPTHHSCSTLPAASLLFDQAHDLHMAAETDPKKRVSYLAFLLLILLLLRQC
jgi:hypothetical protein